MIQYLLAYQALVTIHEHIERNVIYKKARAYADYVQKPLVIVGGAWGESGIREIIGFPAHGFGDVCVDLSEQSCEGSPMRIQANITDIPLSDKFAGAAFCSHVLEHLYTIDEAIAGINELCRIADKVFIVVPHKYSLNAWLYDKHHLWITQNDKNIIIEQRG